tara:strand:- start:83 stop:310 length:228 start_codon:yes stop_codon:yes gene_type:complete
MAPLKDELDKVIFAMVDLSHKWEERYDTDAKSFDNLNQAYQETDKLGTMDFEEWIHRFQLWRDRYQELQEWTEPK